MSLAIARLKNRFHSPEPIPQEDCTRWLQALAETDGEALSAGLTAPEEWLLIRHLPLKLRWRQDASDGEVMLQWSQALRQALEQATSQAGATECVRYRNLRTAIADMLYRSTLGDCSRQWAWARMALIPRATLTPATALQYAMAQLLEKPELIWPILHRLLSAEEATASLSALLRGLEPADWLRLLHASPQSAGYAKLLDQLDRAAPEAPRPPGSAAEAAPGASGSPLASLGAASSEPPPSLPERWLEADAQVQSLLAWITKRPHLAAQHAATLSVLIASLAATAIGSSQKQRIALLRAARAQIEARLGHTASRQPPLAPIHPKTTHSEAPPATRPETLAPLPELVESTEWLATRHAGALFWLARIPASGALEWLAAHPEEFRLPELLQAIARALEVPVEDPALRAFCGGQIPPEARQEIPAALAEFTAGLLAQWQAWLDEQAPELPAPRLASVCQRSGRLRFEPGWIEIHIPLDSVDTRIRRLGLDLDPGWLPWLGCVLRICYDE